MVIQWSDFSKSNLKSFVKNSKLYHPNIYIKSLVENVNILKSNPKSGKIIIIENEIEIRQLIFKMHRIIYHIENDLIRIDAVLHTNYDLDTSLDFINSSIKKKNS